MRQQVADRTFGAWRRDGKRVVGMPLGVRHREAHDQARALTLLARALRNEADRLAGETRGIAPAKKEKISEFYDVFKN